MKLLTAGSGSPWFRSVSVCPEDPPAPGGPLPEVRLLSRRNAPRDVVRIPAWRWRCPGSELRSPGHGAW